MLKYLIATFLIVATPAAYVYAEECKPVPAATQGQIEEVYTGEDAVKLSTVGGAPAADTIVIFLNIETKRGFVYYVKAGCVVGTFEASEQGVENVLASKGVKRVQTS
jgi:hypothetical protein